MLLSHSSQSACYICLQQYSSISLVIGLFLCKPRKHSLSLNKNCLQVSIAFNSDNLLNHLATAFYILQLYIYFGRNKQTKNNHLLKQDINCLHVFIVFNSISLHQYPRYNRSRFSYSVTK